MEVSATETFADPSENWEVSSKRILTGRPSGSIINVKLVIHYLMYGFRPFSSTYETKFWVVVLLSHMKERLIPRRMQFTASRYLLSFQSYKSLNIRNQRDIEKGLGTRICDVI